VGILDESFYLYYDDLDYCRRAKEGGWRVFYWPKARIVHLRGQSNPLKSLAEELRRRPRYFYASRSRYFAKFYGPAGLWLTNLLWTFGRGVSLVRELLGGKRRHVCEKEWLDIWTNWQDPLKPPSRADAQR
jgi:GT2 family glycosyltransferase